MSGSAFGHAPIAIKVGTVGLFGQLTYGSGLTKENEVSVI